MNTVAQLTLDPDEIIQVAYRPLGLNTDPWTRTRFSKLAAFHAWLRHSGAGCEVRAWVEPKRAAT